MNEDLRDIFIGLSIFAFLIAAIAGGTGYNNYLNAQITLKGMECGLMQCRQRDGSFVWQKECK